MKRRQLAATLLLLAAAGGAVAAPRQVHGAHDAWAEPGLALAWGVLRGSDEARTRVVIRIEADAQRHARLSATGRDPFGGGSVDIAVQRAADGAWIVELPRSHFADHPRTELRLFAAGQNEPTLLVYYQGVPDTTPESTGAAALDADLRARIARARSRLPAQRP